MDAKVAVEVLLSRVPAFARARETDDSYISHNDDSSYLVFGDFARFLAELIQSQSTTSESNTILAASFGFLNEMGAAPDEELANLLVVGAFEPLSDSPDCIAICRKYLSGRALELFERTLRGWLSQD